MATCLSTYESSYFLLNETNIKLFRAWFELEIYLGYLYKTKIFLDQMDRLCIIYVFADLIISKILTFSIHHSLLGDLPERLV